MPKSIKMHQATKPRKTVQLRKRIPPPEAITVQRPKGKPYVFPGRLLASANGETLDCNIGQTNEDWLEINVYSHEIGDVNPKKYVSPFAERDYKPPHELDTEATRVVEVIYRSRFGGREMENRYVEIGYNDCPGMCLSYFNVATQLKLRKDKQLVKKLQSQFDVLAEDVCNQL